jgi:hypothetical protein
VKRACEEEKRARSSSSKTLPSSQQQQHRHGSDETMSNDSEKSDDSLLNDFEILKSRGSSSKSSTDEFTTVSNAPDAETQPSVQMTRSTSTQSEYEFSLMDSATQTDEESGRMMVVGIDISGSSVRFPNARCTYVCMIAGRRGSGERIGGGTVLGRIARMQRFCEKFHRSIDRRKSSREKNVERRLAGTYCRQ